MDVRQSDDDGDLHATLAAATSTESSSATARSLVPQHVCSTCRRTFASRRNLVRHQRTHSGEKPFSCARCGALFTQACSLRRHELLHADDTRWSCCQCGRSFSAANLLAVHLLKAHGSGRPGSSTTSSSELQLSSRAGGVQWQLVLPPGECRLRVQQQVTGIYTSSLDSFAARRPRSSTTGAGRRRLGCRCHACDKVLADANSLKRHVLACHVRLRPHECSQCGQCFSRQEHLKKHQRRSIACCVSSATICSSGPSSPASSEQLGPDAPVAGEAAGTAGLPDGAGHCASEDVDLASFSGNVLSHAVLPQMVVGSLLPPRSVDNEEQESLSDTSSPTVACEPVSLQPSVDNLSPTCLAKGRLHSVALQLEDGAAAGQCRDSSMAEETQDVEEPPISDRYCSPGEYFGHILPENLRSSRFIRSAGDHSADLPLLRSSSLSGSSEQQRITELLSALSAGSHSCERCHRTFSSAGYLRLHELTSHREAERTAAKEHVCDRCGSCLSGSGSLKRHALRHLGEKPHACRMCSRAFTQASCLKRHVLACHVRAKPHECGRCGRRFSRLENLKLHQRSKIACKHAGAAVVANRNGNQIVPPMPALREPLVGRNMAAVSNAIRVNGGCFGSNVRPEDFGSSHTVGDGELWGSGSDAESLDVSGDGCSQVPPFNLRRGELPEAADGDCEEDRPTERADVVAVGFLTMPEAGGNDRFECGSAEIKKVLPRRPLLTSRLGITSKHSGGLLGGETSSSSSDESLSAVAVGSSTALSESGISRSTSSVSDEPSMSSMIRYDAGFGDTSRNDHNFLASPRASSSLAAGHRFAVAAPSDGGRLRETLTAAASGCPRHSCEQCGRSFGTAVHLRRHLHTHTGEKPHVCNVCGRQFSQLDSLRRHARLHTGERPHECRSCGRRFSRPWNLKVHELTHNPSQKPHACTFCRSTFSRRSRLKEHVASCPFGRQLTAEPTRALLVGSCLPELVAEQHGSGELPGRDLNVKHIESAADVSDVAIA